MTALVTADLHLNDNPRDAYRHAFMPRLGELARKHAVEHIFILGDLTDDKDRHGARLVNLVVSHVANLALVCPVTILMGNHDYVDPRSPFFGFLDALPGVQFLSQVKASAPLNASYLFLPHTNNYKRDWEGLDFRPFKYVFAHNAFDGCDMGGGRLVEDGVPPQYMRGARAVVSGDIHTPQTVGNITYVGSPYLVDFGDDWHPRVLLLKDKSATPIPCAGPQKRLVSVASLAELDDQRLGAGDILKVRLWLEPHEAATWPGKVEKVREWGRKNDYVVHTVEPVLPTQLRESERRVTSRSDRQLLEEYAAQSAVDERTVKTGLTLMRKA
jgi:hypothetical protein